jgi:flagellar hook-basal body complex protein FliE
MNSINADHLLSQIRTMGRGLQASQITPVPAAPQQAEFGSLLKNTLSAVNDAQKLAGGLKVGFENGSTNQSLVEVMIASQKADLSFRAVTEVRNKLVSAYQDIMNMPV